jgi:hypothetical protein
MHDQLKEGKNYVIMTAHKFEGEFIGIEWENNVSYAMFKTPGEGRYGPSTRKVPVINLISVELKKT